MTFSTPLEQIYHMIFIQNPINTWHVEAYISPLTTMSWIMTFAWIIATPPILFIVSRCISMSILNVFPIISGGRVACSCVQATSAYAESWVNFIFLQPHLIFKPYYVELGCICCKFVSETQYFFSLFNIEAPFTGVFWQVFWSGVFWRIFGHFFRVTKRLPTAVLTLGVFWSVFHYILTHCKMTKN